MIADMSAGVFEGSIALAALRAPLEALYHELDLAVAGQGPVCELSGRCCRFREFGHTLFLSAPEALLMLALAPPPVRELDDGQTCPWQDARGRCTARDARPLGCRVFFCDPLFEGQAAELSEAFLGRLKQLARRHDWPWDYAPLHHHLEQARSEGRFKTRAADPTDTPDETGHG
jgi:hypothetical protein